MTIIKKPLVYIASPFSKGDSVLNLRSSIDIRKKLIEDNIVTPLAPLLAFLPELVHPNSYNQRLNHDFELILHCDAILSCDAYYSSESIKKYHQNESFGRDREIKFANENNIPVFGNVIALYNYFSKQK